MHAFKKNGYLKEIVIATDKSYFDTNTGTHSHFFDIKNKELIDINQVDLKDIPNPPTGKKIKNIDVIINVESE